MLLAGFAPAWALAFRAAPGHVALDLVLTVAAGALPVTAAWFTKLVLDRVTAPGAGTDLPLPHLAAGLALVGAVAAALPQITQYVREESRRRTALLAQDRLYTAVNTFPGLSRFEDARFLDRLRLAEQAGDGTPAMVVTSTFGLVQSLATGLGFFGSLFLLSPPMALLVVVAAVPALLAELALSRRRAAMMWLIGPVERRRLFYSALLSDPRAAKEVRLFGLGDFLRGRMLAQLRAAHATERETDRREAAVQSGLGLLGAGVAGAGLVWAVLAAGRGALTAGDIAMFVAAVAGMQAALTGLIHHLAGIHQHLLLFGHYLRVARAAPDLPVADPPARLPALRRGIELRDVWFRYSDEHEWVLRGVNLTIPHGESVGLVGTNGAGKSTLIKLLCRLYDPTRGAVLWDGVDLRHVDPAALRRRVGVVFQDYMSYDLTARENIGMGDLDALHDPSRIEDAARRAGIDDVLSALPRGYDTLLSRMFLPEPDDDGAQTGVVLSGGQWQRLALARAFLRHERDLLILDEPSSGLDAEAEARVHASIAAHRAGRTSLLVSHRLGALRDADRLVVLDGGEITETGTHAGLLERRGVYARLFALQARGYADELPATAPG
ncbi:ABC transporter ATP-binding protein [Planomonospora sp. ID82291]|uniref:ABC transporter ATP-binding protein n=1 Tax=Planomonospora sp. ID82291 TaxID=2738136 RepID=UPI0018C39A6E|nr:ABC transporter ATP-binding protein [Planomonospora sp. ID82291]MBG0816725.1 ABC transporter ATP-binding protein [Planomonospora sp. ID82291]